MRTNRDICAWICDLADSQRDADITLEAYLRALLAAAEKHAGAPALSVRGFLDLLSEGFTAEPLAFDEAWRRAAGDIVRENVTYAEWREQIRAQIADLRVMLDGGVLGNERRYLDGATAPSGRHWCNFDPCTYLECAAAGSFARAIDDVDHVSWRTFALFSWCGASYE